MSEVKITNKFEITGSRDLTVDLEHKKEKHDFLMGYEDGGYAYKFCEHNKIVEIKPVKQCIVCGHFQCGGGESSCDTISYVDNKLVVCCDGECKYTNKEEEDE